MNKQAISKKDELNNEIDLFDIFAAIGRGIRKFFKGIIDVFLFLFVFGIRKIHWLALIGLLGAGIGLLYNLFSTDYYSSEMVVQPNGFTSIDMVDYINDIHNFCEEGNKEAVANAFQINLETAEKIKNINAFFYIDVNNDNTGDYVDYKFKYDPEDTTKSIIHTRLLIRAEVFDNTIFEEVKKGLLNYINGNEFLITVNNLRKQELNAFIRQADQEIRKLDSLQNFEYFKLPIERQGQSRNGQVVFMNEKQTQLYYHDKIALLDQKLEYQKSLELSTSPVTIIKDFPAVEIVENSYLKYIVLSIFFFCLAGYVLLLIISYWKKIKDYLSSY
jgi:hypothetical protein